jgi:hypothetical protein
MLETAARDAGRRAARMGPDGAMRPLDLAGGFRSGAASRRRCRWSPQKS